MQEASLAGRASTLELPVHHQTATDEHQPNVEMWKAALSLCVFWAHVVRGFPDGAPVDACVKPKPNQPYHGQAQPQPFESLPYQVVASDSRYGPGSKITVRIEGPVPFKGFFLQAREASSGNWIGSWTMAPNTTVHPECSAITHADPKDKLGAVLLWTAPNTAPHGQVYFTGSVLKDYGTFWADLVAGVQQNLV